MNESIEMLHEKVGDLNRQVDKLQRVNGELCAEINRQERRIRELEALVRSLFNTMNTLRINGHAPTGRQLDHYEQRIGTLGLEINDG